ncbi:MAG: hypothetical protein HPY50_01950 [Firmicutes bacterium]|nr:hypothetical protein [Bacillota bacterium]
METTTHSYLKDAFEIIATLCGEGKIEFLFDCRGYKMGVKRFGQKGDYKSLFVFGRKIPGCRMVFKTFSEDSINRYGLTALTTDDLYFIYANLKSIISSVNEVIIDRLEGGQ